MTYKKDGNDMITVFNGLSKELKNEIIMEFFDNKIVIKQTSDAAQTFSIDCKLEVVEVNGKKYVMFVYGGTVPDGYGVQKENLEVVLEIPDSTTKAPTTQPPATEPPTQPPSTTKAPTTQPPTTQPPATEPPTEPSTVAVTDVGIRLEIRLVRAMERKLDVRLA
ncbi:hypothetical protein M3Y94_00021000 [Aphelenchoides besseyi]|nr:hypothetical protein M3Y94_00021000 [Aphelenchoides besseyi]